MQRYDNHINVSKPKNTLSIKTMLTKESGSFIENAANHFRNNKFLFEGLYKNNENNTSRKDLGTRLKEMNIKNQPKNGIVFVETNNKVGEEKSDINSKLNNLNINNHYKSNINFSKVKNKFL